MVSQKAVHRCSKKHGWWDNPRSIPEQLALIHSEVSEALEAYRRDIPHFEKGGLAEELADVVLRIMDLAESEGIGVEDAVNKKHAYNLTRPYRHGGKRC